MALLDIAASTMRMDFARGNIGSVTDIAISVMELPDKAVVGGVYPAASDVEAGVVYGPNGSDFTGTVTLPAAIDVKLNTQYGAGGTEFTGELAGGGGNIFVICD